MTRPRFKRKSLLKRDKVLVIERDKLFCVQCKTIIHLKISEFKQLSLTNGCFHHIVPMVYGGSNTYENVCILCTNCHLFVHSGDEIPHKYIKMYENFIRHGKLFDD